MKTFNQLEDGQKAKAVAESLRRILIAITSGGLRFNDVANGNDLQARIDSVLEEAESPGFSGDVNTLLLLKCQKELAAIARLAARDAVYVENDTVIALDAIK